jgi:multiple sugar transport system ATP-binding protein
VCSLREALGSEVLVHFPVATESDVLVDVRRAGLLFVARVDPQTTARVGEPLRLVVNTKRLHFFDPESGQVIS